MAKKGDRWIELKQVEVLDDNDNTNTIPLKTINIDPKDKVEVMIRIIQECKVIFDETFKGE